MTEAAPDVWRFRANDPGTLSWIAVCAYLSTAALCWRAAKNDLQSREMWARFAIVLAVLGLNKQLDLQTLFINSVRSLTHDPGWYTDRSPVKRLCIHVLTSVSFWGTGWMFWQKRNQWRAVGFVCAGSAMLIAYISLRASPLPHAGQLPVRSTSGAQLGQSILELTGLLFIALGASKVFASNVRR